MSAEEDALAAVKALCLEGESEADHAVHAVDLEVAYAVFQSRSDYSVVSQSNPAPLGETALDAKLVVTSEEPEVAPEDLE